MHAGYWSPRDFPVIMPRLLIIACESGVDHHSKHFMSSTIHQTRNDVKVSFMAAARFTLTGKGSPVHCR